MDRTAEVVGVDAGGSEYTDIPGVVWQGLRDSSIEDEDDDDDDFDEEDEDEDDEGDQFDSADDEEE